jgi:hypothetical protein
MQFYILMIDYGKGPHGPMGFEAVCQPELTRRAIVEQASNILKEGRNTIAFVKFVDGNYIEDISKEIIADASLANCMEPIASALAETSPAEQRHFFNRDHARDLRKHGETV